MGFSHVDDPLGAGQYVVVRENRQIMKAGVEDSICLSLLLGPVLGSAKKQDASGLDRLDAADLLQEFQTVCFQFDLVDIA